MKGGFIQQIISSKSRTFLACCFSFLCGVGMAAFLPFIPIDPLYGEVAIFVPFFFLFLFWRELQTRFWSAVLLLFFLGIFRYSIAVHEPVIPTTDMVDATIVAEPDIRIDGVRYIAEIEESGERVFVSYDLYPRFSYGDPILLSCQFERPEPFDGFRYDMYLATRRVFLVCRDPNIMLRQDQAESSFFRSLFLFKEQVAHQINLLWPEPYASFMAGLLYGYRGGLGSLQEQFNITGVTHIVAISGYNITIISTILLSFFIYLHIRRPQAFWVVVLGIGMFVLFAGASASVVRAGIMGGLVLLAQQMGRSSRIGPLLLLSAVLMLLLNPFLLWYDAGFQLSFLATLGLVYLSPLCLRWFKKVPTGFGLQETLVATIAATIMTLPLILFQFGRLSLVSPLVNILILPVIPLIMSIGFFAMVLSFLSFPLGQAIGFLAWMAMAYIVAVVRFFAHLSFASFEVSLSLFGMITLYGILGYILYSTQKKT